MRDTLELVPQIALFSVRLAPCVPLIFLFLHLNIIREVHSLINAIVYLFLIKLKKFKGQGSVREMVFESLLTVLSQNGTRSGQS